MKTYTENKTYADSGYIAAFKNKAREWAKEVITLYNTPVPPALKNEKEALLKSAHTIKKGIESIFGTIEELENVGLGLPVLIPIAVIAASMAAMYKWRKDWDKFISKIDYHKTLVDKGYSASEANAAIKNVSERGLVNIDGKNLLALSLAGLIAWWVWSRS